MVVFEVVKTLNILEKNALISYNAGQKGVVFNLSYVFVREIFSIQVPFVFLKIDIYFFFDFFSPYTSSSLESPYVYCNKRRYLKAQKFPSLIVLIKSKAKKAVSFIHYFSLMEITMKTFTLLKLKPVSCLLDLYRLNWVGYVYTTDGVRSFIIYNVPCLQNTSNTPYQRFIKRVFISVMCTDADIKEPIKIALHLYFICVTK